MTAIETSVGGVTVRLVEPEIAPEVATMDVLAGDQSAGQSCSAD